jgi:GxxExxY protein
MKSTKDFGDMGAEDGGGDGLEEAEELAYEVIGAAIAVHRELGPGYTEAVYEEALCVELGVRSIPFERQAPIIITYRGQRVGEGRIDILVDRVLIVELKAVETLLPLHVAQVVSYLKAKDMRLGLLLNFNVTHLKNGIKRVIR